MRSPNSGRAATAKRLAAPNAAVGRYLRTALHTLPATVVVGITTFICFAFHLNFPTVSFFYLIIVVLQSLLGDFLSSAVVSVVCFLGLNYFFVPPILSLRVSDLSDSVALASFLVAGLVITRLTSRARGSAESEQLQRQEMTRLYELARELLAMQPQAPLSADVLRKFRTHFGLKAVCLFEADGAERRWDGESQEHLYEQTRTAFISQREFHDSQTGVAVRLLRVRGQTVGSVGFEGLNNPELTAGPLAALVAVMTERGLAFQQASSAAAATETEVFRGAVLDALAHEFKTPLATILTAAGGLREFGRLRPEQVELTEVIESETSRLAQLTNRLLRLARLDREQVKPQMELTDLADVVRSIVEQYSRRWPERRFSFKKGERVDVMGDRELLWLGIGQLLDNASKYSQPGSEIATSLDVSEARVAIRVWNGGSSIASQDRVKIFERFYRGEQARRLTPGSGLGLYVARKIAVAHGGSLELEQSSVDQGITFCFSMARTKGEESS